MLEKCFGKCWGDDFKFWEGFNKYNQIVSPEVERMLSQIEKEFINNPNAQRGKLTNKKLVEMLPNFTSRNLKDITVAVNNVSIPRKGADVMLNRVKTVQDAEMGNNWMTNDYELFTAHQRDYDGDHFYVYNNIT